MILNTFALLAILAALLELALGGALAVLALRALRRRRTEAHGVDERLPLLGHLSTVLLLVAALGWPLLYALLDSYVPSFRGVVCIQGVTRVGRGSVGASRWLPTLLATLEVAKPALLIAIGAFVATYRALPAAAPTPTLGAPLGLLLACGAIAVLDAAAEIAYVAIPKRERFLEAVCCALTSRDGASRSGDAFVSLTTPAYDGRMVTLSWALAGLALLLATTRALRRPRWTYGALLAACLSVPVGLVFLREVAAPALLGRPDHRCAYCVLSSSAVGVAYLLAAASGVLCVVWAAVAQALTPEPPGAPSRASGVVGLLRAGRAATAMGVLLPVAWRCFA